MTAHEKREALSLAKDLLKVHPGHSVATRWLERLTRKPVKRSLPGRSLEAKREEKRATKKEHRAEVRAAVMMRAGGRCERCGEYGELLDALEWDHFFGRHEGDETIERTWALHRTCHSLKTRGSPSRGHWLDAFTAHCERHGYPVPRRFAAASPSQEESR